MSYEVATLLRLDQNADGTPVVVLRYTGNAGELPVLQSIPVNTTVLPSSDELRAIAMARITALNNAAFFMATAAGVVGLDLDVTTPLPSVPPPVVVHSYWAATAPFTPGATPQDVFTVTGSATKKVHIRRISLMTVQTSAGMNAWALVKRSAANTGGTSATVAAVPVDDVSPAASAVVRQYTANPTAGTLIGNLWTGRVPSPVPASAIAVDNERVIEGVQGSPVATLTGTADVTAWNLGGIALPAGLSVQAVVWWDEEG